MRKKIISLFVLFITILSGCAGTTPMSKLSLPPVSTIKGSVTEVNEEGFVLKDNSGEIYVKAKFPRGRSGCISR